MMRIERIELHVTELPVRLKRTFSSGSYDTGPSDQLLGKPVLLKIHAEGVTGIAQIRPISPGHFVADTVHSVIGAIKDIYGPLLIGKRVCDLESIDGLLTSRLAGNPAARALIDIALHDAFGKAVGLPAHALIGGRANAVIPLEWSVSLYDDPAQMVADARRAVEEFGIRVLCLKAAGKGGWRTDVANFERVRAAIGPDIMIGVDPNTGWTAADTVSALHALRDMDVGYCETAGGAGRFAGHGRDPGQGGRGSDHGGREPVHASGCGAHRGCGGGGRVLHQALQGWRLDACAQDRRLGRGAWDWDQLRWAGCRVAA